MEDVKSCWSKLAKLEWSLEKMEMDIKVTAASSHYRTYDIDQFCDKWGYWQWDSHSMHTSYKLGNVNDKIKIREN